MHNLELTSLKNAVPYIRAYKGKTFVFKLGGEICRPGVTLDRVVEQLAVLYHLGIKLVVVHGAGPQANALAKQLKVECEIVDGKRVTSQEMLEVAKMSFAGTVNTNLVAAFRKQKISGVGLSGVDGDLVRASRRPPTIVHDNHSGAARQIDFGLVGDVQAVDVSLLNGILNSGGVPIICSLVAEESGDVLNINADTLACELAKEIQAEKLCLLTQVDGVMRDVNDPSSIISELSITEAEDLLTSGVTHGGMIPKLQTCIAVLQGGVPRAHVVNGLTPDAILKEIFTNEGCGTLIVS